MRIAIVSDIHGNGTAFDAVVADLRTQSPDQILHGGDLADVGPAGAEIVDFIRDAGWLGVIGNTDEMLADGESLERFAAGAPQLETLWSAIREMAAFRRAQLGADRLAWLGQLPLRHIHEKFALVHASAESAWRGPGESASDAELLAAFAPLERRLVAYGHIHHAFVRTAGDVTIANCGSVSLSYDGDLRAAYLLIDDGAASARRVAYDVEREQRRVRESGLPHGEWIARSLAAARPTMP